MTAAIIDPTQAEMEAFSARLSSEYMGFGGNIAFISRLITVPNDSLALLSKVRRCMESCSGTDESLDKCVSMNIKFAAKICPEMRGFAEKLPWYFFLIRHKWFAAIDAWGRGLKRRRSRDDLFHRASHRYERPGTRRRSRSP
jgi:hypothetical protein